MQFTMRWSGAQVTEVQLAARLHWILTYAGDRLREQTFDLVTTFSLSPLNEIEDRPFVFLSLMGKIAP